MEYNKENVNGSEISNMSPYDKKQKIYTIDAAKERLQALPINVWDSFMEIGIEFAFNLFIDELKERRNSTALSLAIHSYEKMWFGIVYSLCMNFRNFNIEYNTKIDTKHLSDSLEIVKKYLASESVPNILQNFNDITQVEAFDTRDNTDEYAYNNYMYNLYKEFVNLYRQCTGTWRPTFKKYHKNTNRTQHHNEHQDNNTKQRYHKTGRANYNPKYTQTKKNNN